jgi:hypothetical protein
VAKRPRLHQYKAIMIKKGGHILLFAGTSEDISCKNVLDGSRRHNRGKE